MLRREDVQRALPFLAIVTCIHLFVAWPGAGERGIIAEEVQPYLHHYPKVLDVQDEHVVYLPPNDDENVRRAADEHRPVAPRWVGTNQWPEVAYQGTTRNWPAFVRGHQTAIGTYWGIALGPLLGDGIGGVRRANVLMGLGALLLVWQLARRWSLSRTWSTVAAVGCVLSPGLWFFCRTGYAYELASRVCMLAALVWLAPREPLSPRRIALVGGMFALAILCRATIATTLAPAVLLMLAHPRRWAGPKPALGVLGLGGGIPVVFALCAVLALPFAQGTTPAAALPVAELAGRTLNVPAFLAMQLGFMVDARVVLSPLVEGRLDAPLGIVRPLLGAIVTGFAFLRFWRAQAGEAERTYLGGLLGNAFLGAWLYKSPNEFQLGMALEPLFVLALVQQISGLAEQRARYAGFVAATLLGLRGMTLGSLWASETRTDNPMLAGKAQHDVVEFLRTEHADGNETITTAYDHVGVFEMWTNDTLRPTHAWRMLVAVGVPQEKLIAQWNLILDSRRVCRVLITRAPSLVAGPFTDHAAVAAALEQALVVRQTTVTDRSVIAGNGGGQVFEVLTLSSCAGTKGAAP